MYEPYPTAPRIDTRAKIPAIKPEIKATFGEILINLPADSMDIMIDETVNRFKNLLQASDTLRKFIANLIRPEI